MRPTSNINFKSQMEAREKQNIKNNINYYAY